MQNKEWVYFREEGLENVFSIENNEDDEKFTAYNIYSAEWLTEVLNGMG